MRFDRFLERFFLDALFFLDLLERFLDLLERFFLEAIIASIWRISLSVKEPAKGLVSRDPKPELEVEGVGERLK